MKDHYLERIEYARKSDDYAGRMSEIVKGFLRDLTSDRIPSREVQAIARMLDEASCEAAQVAA